METRPTSPLSPQLLLRQMSAVQEQLSLVLPSPGFYCRSVDRGVYAPPPLHETPPHTHTTPQDPP